MATRSHIGVKNHKEGTVDYIYCHWDGYPKHVGKVLTEYYQDMDRVNALMKLGDLSSLGPEIGEKHEFGNSPNPMLWCTAYGRDRREPNSMVHSSTFEGLLSNDCVDYLYVFDGEFWNCYDTYTKKYINLYHE
jgi:hypothetical protein